MDALQTFDKDTPVAATWEGVTRNPWLYRAPGVVVIDADHCYYKKYWQKDSSERNSEQVRSGWAYFNDVENDDE